MARLDKVWRCGGLAAATLAIVGLAPPAPAQTAPAPAIDPAPPSIADLLHRLAKAEKAAADAAKAAANDVEALRGTVRQLQADAQQAHSDLAGALARAKRADDAIEAFLRAQPHLRPQPIAAAPAALAGTSTTAATVRAAASGGIEAHLIDGYQVPGPDRKRSDYQGLMAYVVNPSTVDCTQARCGNETGTIDGAERLLSSYFKDRLKKNPPKFSQQATGVNASITGTKQGAQAQLSYEVPFDRRRAIALPKAVGKAGSMRTITTSVVISGRATITSGNSFGTIATNAKLSDDPLGFSLALGRQYYPSVPLLGPDRKSVESRARTMVAALVKRCEAAKGTWTMPADAAREIYLAPDGSAPVCSGEGLIQWAFDPEADGYKANVAAYNDAIWNAGAKVLPEYGWGIKADVGRAVYRYIDPTRFESADNPAGPQFLLPTLAFDDDAAKANLGGVKASRYNVKFGGYGFRHIASKQGGPAMTLIIRADYGNQWAFRDANGDPLTNGTEFCAQNHVRTALAGTKTLDCAKFNTATPSARWGFEPSVELRTTIDLKNGYLPSIGLAPSAAFNTADDRRRINIPLYLAFDKDSKLDGGIQFTHASGGIQNGAPRKDENIWSVFISTPLNLAGNR